MVKSYFNNDGLQNYLVFLPIQKTVTTYSGHQNTISEWDSKGFSNEKFTPPYTANKSLSTKLVWNNYRIRLRFEVSCLKQEDEAPFTPNNVVNLYIVYELDRWSQNLNTDFNLKDCLFGAVKITKNADPDKYVYTGYGIEFDSISGFSLPDGSAGKNVIIFEVDMRSSVHINNKKKDILILGFSPTQGLNGTTLTGEAQYSITFSRSNRKFCLRLHYNGSNSFLFVNATKIYQLKVKNSEMKNIHYG